MIPCPKCHFERTSAINMLGNVRERKCRKCDHVFTTEELVRNGRVENKKLPYREADLLELETSPTALAIVQGTVSYTEYQTETGHMFTYDREKQEWRPVMRTGVQGHFKPR